MTYCVAIKLNAGLVLLSDSRKAAKCALVSMDSTLKSNLSVGLPLDMVVCIDQENPCFQMMHSNWGKKLREVFGNIIGTRQEKLI
ncbi:MAG: hypothetical protein RL211_1227 [Pseudomonadota bacterium]|jgi:predicted proteasome-type protease